MKIYKLVLITLIFALIGKQTHSQSKIPQSVLSNGSLTVLNKTYRISGTIGQTIIGQTSNQINIVKSGFWYSTSNFITGIDQKSKNALPKEFYLFQNYPNPFNPTTIISFSVAKQAGVNLALFDLLGRKVLTMKDEIMQPGRYKFNFKAGELASGVYFYRLSAIDINNSRHVFTKKMMILK